MIMAITSQTMLEDRIGAAELVRLTDDGLTGSVDADVLARVTADGEGELLNNIGQRYVLPLALGDVHTAAAVRAMMLDAVIYRLYQRRDRRMEVEIVEAYTRARAWSERIAAGTLGLVGETRLSESPAQAGRVIVTGSERVIDRESMKGL
jgi:phage gp36-like protein